MTKEIHRIILLSIIALLLPIISSCDFDQVEDSYPAFTEANKNGLFEKGWIPSALVFNSMTNIYQRTNLDLNSCIFNYNISSEDLNLLKNILVPTSIKFKKPRRVEISSEWVNSVKDLKHYYFVDSSEITDTIFIAIDTENNKIYGWRK